MQLEIRYSIKYISLEVSTASAHVLVLQEYCSYFSLFMVGYLILVQLFLIVKGYNSSYTALKKILNVRPNSVRVYLVSPLKRDIVSKSGQQHL